MAEYIDAIHNPNPQPISQPPTSFDPKSPANQKLLGQIQKSKMVTEVFLEWLDGITQSGTEYFKNLSKVYENITVMRELETEITNWKKEETKWIVVVAQMNDVQTYGIMKFLSEKPVQDLDDNVLYVCKKSIE